MPHYSFKPSASTGLSNEQQDKITEAVNEIHTDQFKTRSEFVKISFDEGADTSADTGVPEETVASYLYFSGDTKAPNSLVVLIRDGPDRNADVLAKLADRMKKVWAAVTPSSSELSVTVFDAQSLNVLKDHEDALADLKHIEDNYEEWMENTAKNSPSMKETFEFLLSNGLLG